MAADLKLEIIYYKTPSDFEMEFELCGCCSMRMLTSKPNTKKDMLISLSSSVSRSKATVIVGELFGDDGIISSVSTAVGIGLDTDNQKSFRVPDGVIPSVPSGATPIVSDDGMLAGFIITSGPQVIILLSSNRKLRHSVLKSQIYEYVRLISRSESPNDALAAVYKGKHSRAEETVPEVNSQDETPTSHSITPEELGTVTENIVMSNSTDDDFKLTYPENNKPKNINKHPVLSTFICIFAAIVLAITGTAGYYFLYEPYAAKKLYDGYSSSNAYALSKINSDFAFLISVSDFGINYPVVNASDNLSYYTTHLFDGSVNRFGTPYTVCDGDCDNTVIYGFSDSSGFGNFSKFLESTPKITIQDSEGTVKIYTVFSVFDATDLSLGYELSTFVDISEKQSLVDNAVKLDVMSTGELPKSTDKLLTVVNKEKGKTTVIMAYLKTNTTEDADKETEKDKDTDKTESENFDNTSSVTSDTSSNITE